MIDDNKIKEKSHTPSEKMASSLPSCGENFFVSKAHSLNGTSGRNKSKGERMGHAASS